MPTSSSGSTKFSAPCKMLEAVDDGFVHTLGPARAAHKPLNPWTGSSMVEQLTLNQRVAGSSPARFTNSFLFNVSSRRGSGLGNIR